MALTTYAELQTAIQAELDIAETTFVASIPDLINRAESKINRKLRLREMEQLAYATYSAGTTALADRLLALPNAYVELIPPLRIKPATAADTAYEEVLYVDPGKISQFYGASAQPGTLRYTLRDQLEFSAPVGTEHTVMMHYLKGWDLAANGSNWLLTNYPDTYLYGALSEAEMFIRNDVRVPMWKALFDECIADLQELSERGRDDAELDVSEVGRLTGRGTFNILTG